MRTKKIQFAAVLASLVMMIAAFFGFFAMNKETKVQASAETGVTITQVQFRSEGTNYFFFLRMDGQTDYTQGNQVHAASFVNDCNVLDKVTVYFFDGAYTLRELWKGDAVTTYKWGDADTLAFQMKAGFVSNKGIGAKIEAGTEIPMISGEKKVTTVSRTFWNDGTANDVAISQYTDGYTPITTSLTKVHLRGMMLIGLGEGNDWDGKGEALPTQAVGTNGSSSYAGTKWLKLYAANFTSKIKLHVKETNTWVTLGEALNPPTDAPQWVMVFNGWGETGGIIRLTINTAYNGTTIDQIFFEEGCELPSYAFIGNNISHTVHVLDKAYLCTSNNMDSADFAVDWSFSNPCKVTFNGGNETIVNHGSPVAYPTELSETKPGDEYGTYVYNWYLNGELYDFSKPVTGNINLTSDGSFTCIPKEYKITYYAIDGVTPLFVDKLTYGETISVRAATSVEGYENCSWAYGGEGDIPTTMPAKDLSFTLSGTPKTYTLVFTANGAKVTEQTVTFGEAVNALPQAPEKAGYSAKWMVNGAELTAQTLWMTAADGEATASYTPNSYTLTFKNGTETVTTATVTYDAPVGELPAVPAKEFYNGCWMVNGAELTAQTLWTTAADGEAIASYTLVQHTVTFDGKDAVSVTHGETMQAPADATKAPTSTISYQFDGWYLGEKKWDFATDTVQSDCNLTAKFIEVPREYTLTFVVSGADMAIAPMQAGYGSVVDLVAIVEAQLPEGYSYSISIGGVDKVSVKVTADATVEVVFTPMEQETSGCGGSIAASMLGALALCGAAIVLKKKENE